MKSYNVKQIAEMLGTNPETIRRWIRDGKLDAVQTSRKDGNVITESELKRFLKKSPKYLAKFTIITAAALAPTTGVAFFTAFAAGTMSGIAAFFLECITDKDKPDSEISALNLKRVLRLQIHDITNEVKKKQKRVESLQKEIQKLQKEIQELQNQIAKCQELLEDDDLIDEIVKETRKLNRKRADNTAL